MQQRFRSTPSRKSNGAPRNCQSVSACGEVRVSICRQAESSATTMMNYTLLTSGAASCADVRPPGLAVISTLSECLTASDAIYPSATLSGPPEYVTPQWQSRYPVGCSFNKFSCSGTCPPDLRVNAPDPNVSTRSCGTNRRCLCRVVMRNLTDADFCSMLGGVRNSEYPRACCSASCGLGGCNNYYYYSDCNPETFYGTRQNHNRPCSTRGITPCTIITGLPADSPSPAPESSPSPGSGHAHHRHHGGHGGMHNGTSFSDGGATIGLGLILGLVLVGLLIPTLIIYYVRWARSKSKAPNDRAGAAPAPRVRAVHHQAQIRPTQSPGQQQFYLNPAPALPVLPVPLVQAGQPLPVSPVTTQAPQDSPYSMYQLQQPIQVPVGQPVIHYPVQAVPVPVPTAHS